MLGKLNKMKKAFTLVELLIVMVIIGILIGLSVFGLSLAQKSARTTDRISSMNQVALAIDSYFTLNRKFPCNSGDVSSNATCDAFSLNDIFIAKISNGDSLNPAKGTNWSQYSYGMVNGAYYIATVTENAPSGCQASFYGGGVTSTGLSAKQQFASGIANNCWVN